MAKYDKAECERRVAAGLMTTFDKRFTCFLEENPDGTKYVVMVADNGDTFHDHLTFRSRSDGLVYGLETTSGLERWWGKATGFIGRLAGGITKLLDGPLGAFLAVNTGWPIAKLLGKLKSVKALNPGDIEAIILEEVGSHKAGRLLLAAKEALRLKVGTPEQLAELDKLLNEND